MNARLRKVVIFVALLNLAYFGVEFAIARLIGSVSLFADSVDFLEDASLNALIALALGWTATSRARLSMASGRHSAHSWCGHALDRMGQNSPTIAACAGSFFDCSGRGFGGQSDLRFVAGPVS